MTAYPDRGGNNLFGVRLNEIPGPNNSPLSLATGGAAIVVTGNIAENIMLSPKINGGQMGRNGYISVRGVWRRTTGAGAITVRFRLNSAGDTSTGILYEAAAPADGTLNVNFTIQARGVQNSQLWSLNDADSSAGSAPVISSVDMTQDQYLVVTGRLDAVPTDVLELQSYNIVLHPRN